MGGDTTVSSLTAFHRSTPGAIGNSRHVLTLCQRIKSISDRTDHSMKAVLYKIVQIRCRFNLLEKSMKTVLFYFFLEPAKLVVKPNDSVGYLFGKLFTT